MKKQEKSNPQNVNCIKILLFSIGLFFFFSYSAYSRSVQDNMAELKELQRKETLKKLLALIEHNTKYVFVYRNSEVDLAQTITVTGIDFEHEPIEHILNEVLKNTGLTYQISDKQIIIKKDSSKSSSSPKATSSLEDGMQILVKGKVTDSQGYGMAGVNIMIKGTTNGTITDINGNFNLASIQPNAILRISFIGYKALEVRVKKNLTVTLNEDNAVLDEIVVVGYGTQTKANLSGAVDAVNSKVLSSRPLLNLGQGLQGIIPNLNIGIANGAANTSPSFNVRGFTSINGGEPLILIDNVPTNTTELARINPNDIANISVLKDASSAAIYGARAAFGVVLITTKNGKSEKVSVGLNANYSLRRMANLPEIETDPYTVVTMKNPVGKPSYDPVFSDAMVALAKKHSENPSLSPYEQYPEDPTKWAYFGRTNWLDEFFKNSSPTYQLNADISQKTNKGSYFISAQYLNQDGMLNYGNDTYKRYNLRSKVNFQLTDWLEVGNNTSLGNTIYDMPSCSGNSLADMLYDVAHIHSILVPKNPDGTWSTDPQGWLTGGRNFAILQNGGRRVTNSRDISSTFNAKITIIKNVWNINADATIRRNSESTKESRFPYTYRRGPELAIVTSGTNPTAVNGSTFYDYNVYNVYTDFHQTFDQRHQINGILGFNQESSRSDQTSASRANLISTTYPTVQLATGIMNVSEAITSWAVRGAFARFNYIYDNRYIAEFNGRYDGTSRFPKKDRYGFFPSGSIAWILSEEKFMKSLSRTLNLNNLKLRFSYGSLGNQNVGAYAYIPSMTSYQSSMILDGSKPTAISGPGLVSSSLTWEKVNTINEGIDLIFFRNRLTASFDHYERRTEGMLTKSVTLPNVLGTAEPQENAANLKTKGWELSLKWQDQFSLANSPLNYSIGITLADSRTYITKFANKNIWYGQSYYEGMEVGEIWGLETEGYFQSDEEVKQHANQSQVGSWNNSYQFSAGDLKFKNQNNDNVINRGDGTTNKPGDFKIIGNRSARLPYSIDLAADWKGFDIRAFFQGVGKKDWYPTADNQYFWGIYANPWANVLKQNMDYWTPENPNAYYPRPKSYVARNTGEELACNQTKYLQNASYLRLQNLMIGYTLPASLSRRFSIERLRIYFSAENVFELDHLHTKMDVSTLTSNANSEAIYPMQRTFSMGINLNF